MSIRTKNINFTILPKLILAIFKSLLLSLIFYNFACAEWEWRSVTPMNEARSGHSAAVVGRRIYVFGGINARMRQENLLSAEVYNPQNDRWEYIRPLPYALYQATAVAIGDYIYILGGMCCERMNNNILRYNTNKDEYEVIGAMPSARRAMGAVNIGNTIMIVGGISQRQEYPRGGLLWNVQENRWSETQPLNQPSAGLGVIYNGLVWVVGGMYFGPIDRVEVYENERWRLLERARMLEARGDMGTSFLNDTILVIAGGTGLRGAILNTVHYLNTRTLQWSQMPSMILARTSFSLKRLDNRLYAIGGITSVGQMNEATNEVEVLIRTNSVSDDSPQANPEIQPKFSIHPNPIFDIKSISIPNSAVKISLFDSNGRLIVTESLNCQNTLFNLPSGLLLNGNVFYIIYMNDGQYLTGYFTIIR